MLRDMNDVLGLTSELAFRNDGATITGETLEKLKRKRSDQDGSDYATIASGVTSPLYRGGTTEQNTHDYPDRVLRVKKTRNGAAVVSLTPSKNGGHTIVPTYIYMNRNNLPKHLRDKFDELE